MTTTATSAMMAKVRGLLDTAESLQATNPEAAANYQAKAEELMVKYRIQEEETLAKDQFAVTPMPFDYAVCNSGSPYRVQYMQMWGTIARHVGVRSFLTYKYDREGTWIEAKGVGYQSDNEYADMLYTTARLVFAERLEPKIDYKLSDQENVYRLRSAGIERIRIAEMLWGNTDKVFLGRVGRLYKAECAQRGEVAALSGRGVTGAAYREQYAESFVYQLAMRLRQAQDSAGRAGGGLVLAGREDRITEAFYQRFPDQRPKAAVGGGTGTVATRCDRCAKAKSGACRDHPRGRTVSGGRDYYSTAAMRGREAGAAAARAVKLHRGGTDSIGGA